MAKKLSEQLKLQNDIEVPWESWRFFGPSQKTSKILVSGNQASFGEDFGSLEELRKAIEWYVEQLDGEVKWQK